MTGCRGLSPPKHPISALPRDPSPRRSACGQSRGEPAIAGLDWSFAPTPSSSERFARQHRFGPPPLFRGASTWLGVDRPASGLSAMTPGDRTPPLTRQSLAVGTSLSLRLRAFALSLAIAKNSPARFSKRTTGRWAKPFHALSACNHLVSGSFHLPLGVLFSFRSPY